MIIVIYDNNVLIFVLITTAIKVVTNKIKVLDTIIILLDIRI